MAAGRWNRSVAVGNQTCHIYGSVSDAKDSFCIFSLKEQGLTIQAESSLLLLSVLFFSEIGNLKNGNST